MNQVITKGIILSRTNYQEADRILTILTPDQGKIKAVAKGVRKSRSKMAAGTELLSISEIGFIRGKGELVTLTTARLEVHFGNIVNQMDRTMYAYDLLKRFNRLTEDNAEPEYFELLSEILGALHNLERDQDEIQLWSLVRLLLVSGHQPELERDNQGKALLISSRYSFDTDAMAFYNHSEGPYEAGHIKVLRLCLNQSLERLATIAGLEQYVPAMLRLVQTICQTYLRA